MNLGNLMRSAHAFGASYIFTINAHYKIREAYSDTSRTPEQIPYFPWDSVDDMHFPKGCQIVGIELLEEAVDLPSFHHPSRAAYVLGPERGSLSPELTGRCDHIVRIPTSFCINVATAGAVVMYDRIKSLGRFAAPPVHFGGPKQDEEENLPVHAHGKPRNRSENR